jgi:hypothetical protein
VFVKTFGLFWRRDEVEWNPGQGMKGVFRLLGRQGKILPGLRLADYRGPPHSKIERHTPFR